MKKSRELSGLVEDRDGEGVLGTIKPKEKTTTCLVCGKEMRVWHPAPIGVYVPKSGGLHFTIGVYVPKSGGLHFMLECDECHYKAAYWDTGELSAVWWNVVKDNRVKRMYARTGDGTLFIASEEKAD
jgi:hypothetical protein